MNRAAPKVWQRLIPASREDAWLERLVRFDPRNCAVTYLPGRKSAQLAVYGLSPAEQKKLLRDCGGKIVTAPTTRQLVARRHDFCLPLPPRLCLASSPAAIPARHQKLPRLIIPAGMAFGTGEHATTGMCLRRLTELLPAAGALRVLDAGTGSGILALAAGLLGNRVTAIDYDAEAVAVARANAKLNPHIPPVRWQRADLLRQTPAGQYDLIAANLFATLLVQVLPKFKKLLAPGGAMILSGILKEQEPLVTAALKKSGFTVTRRYRKGKWLCLTTR